ncbi:MAG: hypothetical protein FWG68_04390 [Defluviitaleaceae bacterium]|nr:hypothetical protein [Defluviitaleaceae bacterium]
MLYLIRNCSGGGEFSQGNLLNKFFPNNVVNGRCVSIFFASAASQDVSCAGGVLFAESSNICGNGGTFSVTNRNCQARIIECSPFTLP